jgi:hypothetical protein
VPQASRNANTNINTNTNTNTQQGRPRAYRGTLKADTTYSLRIVHNGITVDHSVRYPIYAQALTAAREFLKVSPHVTHIYLLDSLGQVVEDLTRPV